MKTEAFLKKRVLDNGREFILDSVPLGKRYYPVETTEIRVVQNLELDTGKRYDVTCILVEGHWFPLELLTIPLLEN